MSDVPNAKRRLSAFALICAMPILASCASLTGSAGTDPLPGAGAFCEIARPVTWSSRDTDETILQVKAHNAVGKRLCGWTA